MYYNLHSQSTDVCGHLQLLRRIHVFMLSHPNIYGNYSSKLTDKKVPNLIRNLFKRVKSH